MAIDLLRIRLGMGLDGGGRIAGHWGVTIAAAPDGQGLFLGSALPQRLADALQSIFNRAARDSDPSVAPPALAPCERVLAEAGEPLRLSSGPSYLIPAATSFAPATDLAVSTRPWSGSLRLANPGNWLPDEWDDLLDGTLGPWAMATVNGRVVSICHTPRPMTAQAAEAGVWTDRDFRGKGHAAAVTAAWAALLEPTGRHLFYSTDAANRSSQRVAARLNLRPIGWTWSLARPPDNAEYHRHPLSRPRPSNRPL